METDYLLVLIKSEDPRKRFRGYMEILKKSEAGEELRSSILSSLCKRQPTDEVGDC